MQTEREEHEAWLNDPKRDVCWIGKREKPMGHSFRFVKSRGVYVCSVCKTTEAAPARRLDADG